MDIEKHTVEIGHLSSGQMISIPYISIDSKIDGPCIYIQSGIHGGEITLWILKALVEFLKSKPLLKGKLRLVTCANPLSWLQRSYYYTHGKFSSYNGVDWNRLFPGSENKDGGSRIASALFSLAKDSDFVIDLHTARKSFPFAIYTSNTPKDFVKAMGFKYNQLLDVSLKASYKGTLNAQLDILNIPNVTLECGSHDSCNQNDNKYCLDGILRLLNMYGMIEQKNISNTEVWSFENTLKLYANDGGLIQYHCDIGDRVKEGDLLYTIINPIDIEVETNEFASFNGVILKRAPTHIMNFGDETIEVIRDEAISIL